MDLKEMQLALGMEQIPEDFYAIYCNIADSWQDRANLILSESYITKTLDDCFALIPYRAEVLAAAEEIRKNPAMQLLICLLEQWIRQGGRPVGDVYTPPVGTGLAYDFLHLFPAIPTMPESVAYLRKRNVPEDVIAATLQEYDESVQLRLLAVGKPCFTVDRLNWLRCVIFNRILHIGRFKYDFPSKCLVGMRVYENAQGEFTVLADNVTVHPSGYLLGTAGYTDPEGAFLAEIQETDTAIVGYPAQGARVMPHTVSLDKSQWRLRLCPDDSLVRIHIPRNGAFDKQTILDSYRRAKEVFKTSYPDMPFKAFLCSSWLMSPDLRSILKPTSNILGFQDTFTHIPFSSTGRLVFSFVFPGCPYNPELFSQLPEETSLQRAVKQRYMSGDFIRDGAGFFL
jgi:hypothetical protein